MSTINFPSHEKICEMVDKLQPEAIEKLKQLVSFDSLLGNEKDVQEYIHEVFNSLGLKVDRVPIVMDEIKDLPGFSPVEWEYNGKENIIGIHEPTPSDYVSNSQKKSLIFNGHIDVVPTGRDSLWEKNPFSPYVKDGRLYGRGSGDMKAGVIAFIIAYKAIKELGFLPASKLMLQTVVEEECTGNGTLACLARGYKADACIIPEPFPQIITAQVGLVWCRVTVQGRPAHVLEMGSGVNAIDGAMYVVAELRKLEEQWNNPQNIHPAFKQFKHPLNFNLGIINGGEWTSSVPCECTFELRAGFYPGADLKKIREELVSVIDKAATDKGLPYQIKWNGFQAEGYLTDPELPMMKALGETYRKALNREPEYSPVLCTTDTRFFGLYYGIPATCLGPESSHIHGIDESVSLESLRDITRVLACFISDWCGLQPAH
ncbi:Acetylornitine deacetylase [Tieghemostelium lacteum]|uniref:Acetylornitine deacetylase n=1 Tax=Tieghemostelium lacteum TaxID=361077 RepID=A0A151Z3T8_TIELA|nr:Acetylornitine deacetylase [Tieghemostelium lacteum]|eukprot:KYQ88608.1 Acetylornitine deacetylase [Tieghemostelium lacteum]